MTSLRAKIVAKLLPLTGIKASFSDPEKLKIAIAKDRKNGPAHPPSRLRKTFDVTSDEVHGYKVFGISPKGMSENATDHHILYIHGGAYVLDLQGLYWTALADIARRSGAAMTVPCYPMAPEAHWDESYAWMEGVYDALVAKVGSANITIMGDSAGAGFALGFTQKLQEKNKSLPGKMILLSPWLDVTMTDDRQPELEKVDAILGIDGLIAAGQWWAGDGADAAAAPVSPLFGPLEALPPIAVFTGGADILNPDARRFRDMADANKIDISYHEADNMQHIWMMLPIPEAIPVRQKIADFIKS